MLAYSSLKLRLKSLLVCYGVRDHSLRREKQKQIFLQMNGDNRNYIIVDNNVCPVFKPDYFPVYQLIVKLTKTYSLGKFDGH